MLGVIGINGFHCLDNFIHSAKAEHSTVISVMLREAGLLNNDGATSCEIAGAAIAKPTGVQADILIFRDGEFAFGMADIVPVEPVIDA